MSATLRRFTTQLQLPTHLLASAAACSLHMSLIGNEEQSKVERGGQSRTASSYSPDCSALCKTPAAESPDAALRPTCRSTHL